jgi:hypothetical protein
VDNSDPIVHLRDRETWLKSRWIAASQAPWPISAVAGSPISSRVSKICARSFRRNHLLIGKLSLRDDSSLPMAQIVSRLTQQCVKSMQKDVKICETAMNYLLDITANLLSVFGF